MYEEFLNVSITLKNTKNLARHFLTYKLPEKYLSILTKITNTKTENITLSDVCDLLDIRNYIKYGPPIPSQGIIIYENKPMSKPVSSAYIMEENEKRKMEIFAMANK